MSTLARLAWELFKISLLVIGGGYAIIVVADGVFSRLGWTKEGELLDRLPVFQMVPGLIATHVAVYVGRKVAGRTGAVVGVAAVALPSVVIFTFVSMGYRTLPLDSPWLGSAFVGLRAGLTGIIAATVLRGWTRNLKDAFAYSLMIVSLAAVALLRVNVAVVLLVAMAAGVAEECAGGVRRFRASWLPLLLFLKYGSLCFGGGFVLVPMYLQDFVGPTAAYLQITADEFADLMALTQLTPGPIGVNGATFFGYRLAGVPGAVLASAALLLPGSVLAYVAFQSLDRFRTNRIVRGILRGAKPASVALMLSALWAFATMTLWGTGEAAGGSVWRVSCGEIWYNVAAILLTLTAMTLTMKKKLSVMTLILLCALAATAVRAEEITCERFPDADTVLVDSVERVKYNPDGTSERWEESWTKILTEKGRRAESTVTLDYSLRYGTGEIVYVGAIGADGQEREIDVSATTKESTDNSSMSANIYDPLDRVIVCGIPGLKVGDTVHVKTHRKVLKPYTLGKWADASVMEWTRPIIRATYVVTAPPELPLRKIVIRNPLGNIAQARQALDDGSTVHTFTVTNSAQAFPEPDMPPLYTQVQNVRVSTAENWPEISEWYWGLCEPHILMTNAAMTNKVNEIGRDVRGIFRFVSQEIRYMGLTMEDTSPGYAPHDVNITFDNRYGVCRDKAGLLVAMLRIAGFRAYPVLINVGAKLDPDVPQPFFNHAIVAVEAGEGVGAELGAVIPSTEHPGVSYVLMDPTNEHTKDLFPAYLSDKSFLVCRPDGEGLKISPVPPPAANAVEVNSSGTLSKDGSLVMESAIAFRGINDTSYRGALVRCTPEERVKLFERVVKAVAVGAELLKCEIEPQDLRDTETPLSVRLVAKYPEMVLQGRTQDELSVPMASATLGVVNWMLKGSTSLEKRKYALELSTTAQVSERMTIDLGDALGPVATLPPPVRTTDGYDYERAFAVTGGTLYASRALTLSAVSFTPEQYLRMREEIKRAEAAGRKRPVFAKDELKDADVRWLLNSSETSVKSDREWVTTNRIVKEVLTYAGKKSEAEMKIGYNPSWQHLTLTYATVSNRDGRVYGVSPKEMNVMDCGWAAAAPRYPAGRLLVVNLPSVEIGSVISYELVTTVTNAPAALYGVYLFDTYSPVERKIVRVDDWRREVVNPRRLADEPNQPYASLWRDHAVVSYGDWPTTAARLRKATDVATDGEHAREILAAADGDAALDRIRGIRDWMAKNVKIVGPSLYELPVESQLTEPAVVLKERYATRLDYIRTMCALLRGAGLDADIVFAAGNADEPEVIRNRDKYLKPNVRAFSSALCRVRFTEGGFLGIGGTERTYFIGAENQYAELGATGYEDSDYFDPERETFGVVTVPSPELATYTRERTVYDVRENGAVDLTVENETLGPGVAAFRKTWSEILPEERSRRYLAMLGGISQAASATSELETDVTGYPARRRFTCYVPDLASVANGTITLQLPGFITSIPSTTGTVRKTPFALGATDGEMEVVTVRFPEGYTEIEHLPEDFLFTSPVNPAIGWMVSGVSSAMVDGRLEVRITRVVSKRAYSWFDSNLYGLLKDWDRIESSRANRTIVVRKGAAGK